MYEDCPSYKLYYSYDANGFLRGIKRILANGSTENYGVHCNIFGDVISIYYEDGMLAATYTYDSWGKLLSVTETFGADVADAINDTHKGWKLGDNVTKLTKSGNTPSWSTIRSRYWKNETLLNSHKYTDSKDIDLMKKGRAPIGYDSKPMELHHPYGRVGGDNFFIFYPMSHSEHKLLHYGR